MATKLESLSTKLQSALDLANSLPAAVEVDDTLSVEGAAADAKAVGEAISASIKVTSVGGKTGAVDSSAMFSEKVGVENDNGYARLYASEYSVGLELKHPSIEQPTFFLISTTSGDPAVSVNGEYKKLCTLLDAYPVGAIYMSAQSTSPASLFGGTWTQMTDRFLLGAGNAYVAGSKGGKWGYNLYAAIGAVNGDIKTLGYIATSTSAYMNAVASTYVLNAASAGTHSYWSNGTRVTDADVESSLTTIMPPYEAVYMWKRVS